MTTDFLLRFARADGGSGVEIRIQTQEGASSATSADGSVTVLLPRTNRQDSAAASLADALVRAGRDLSVVNAPAGGCVVVDRRDAAVTVVMPHIGLRHLYWRDLGIELALSSRPDRLASLGDGDARISPDALYRYVYFHMVPGPASVFESVAKLDAGHRLRWGGSKVTVERFWRPCFVDEATWTEEEAARELFEVLRRSVRRSLDGSGSAGAFLSGGLDSSTVTGFAAEEHPGLPTVSMGFDARGYDEMEFARIASRHFGTRPLEYYVTPDDVLATLPAIAAAFPEPFGNSSAAAAYHCARIAREHGIDRLLAGDGGDELFGGNERYARQLVFERYGRVPQLVRDRLLEPLIGAAARLTQAFPIGKAASFVQQASVPLPDRLQSYNFLHRHAPSEVFTPALLERARPSEPLRLLRDEYGVPATTSPVNRMLFLDWKFTLQDNDLVKVNTMCDLAGIEVAYPMLDAEVVEHSLRVPGDWKVRRGELRWYYKRAMRGFLPREIIAKTKHGFGLPFGVWTRTHAGLRRLSEELLASLAERGYFRREFLDDALRLHREGHASYYGELVWILLVLELWLQRNSSDARL